MPVISNRQVSVTFTDDLNATLAYDAIQNEDSPGSVQLITLAIGNNTITLPGGGAVPASVIIIPPVDNEEVITLKGVNGDTGIVINPVDPTVLTFNADSLPTFFVLNAAAEIIGLTLVWA